MLFNKILSRLLYWYLLFAVYTSRWQMKGYQPVVDNANAKKPQIFTFWHGRFTMMPAFRPKVQETFVISSRHRDGELSANILQAFGLKLIRGSSRKPGSNKDRGGQAAFLEALRKLRAGYAIAITPDGPRGPRMRVSGHIVSIARMTGAEIIPISFSSTHGKIFNSWDRFFLPLPFGRAYYFVGKPIAVPRGSDEETVEKFRQKLEDTLNQLTKSADLAANRKDSPEPAPLV